MQGYEASTPGDRYADVYDELYAPRLDTEAAVATLADLAAGGPVLELGVGTGRLAIPLAERGLDVHGVDASEAMVERLRARSGGERVNVVVGDMAAVEYPSPVALVVVAANTFFNLTSAAAQRACLARVGAALVPGGRLVVEAYVPEEDAAGSRGVEARRVEPDRVVLSAWQAGDDGLAAQGQHVVLTGNGIRLHPWVVNAVPPHQLDEMTAAVGLDLEHRWAGWERSPFDDAPSHVSVYRSTRH